VWSIGPIIDNFAEPRYRALAPGRSEPASTEFLSAQKQYLWLELFATVSCMHYGLLDCFLSTVFVNTRSMPLYLAPR